MNTHSKTRFDTRTAVMLGLFAALAYAAMFLFRIPIVAFLKYDPKDVIIAISGFLCGPLPAVMVSVVVSLIEMLTVSETGIIGCFMNVLSTVAFVCPAAFLYKRSKSFKSAVIGLAIGVLSMTSVMLLWNYFIVPFYMHTPRQEVAAMLLPVFLPFNLLKSSINAALVVLLYKPLVTALRRMNLMPRPAPEDARKHKVNIGAMLAALLVLGSCVMVVLVMQGII